MRLFRRAAQTHAPKQTERPQQVQSQGRIEAAAIQRSSQARPARKQALDSLDEGQAKHSRAAVSASPHALTTIINYVSSYTGRGKRCAAMDERYRACCRGPAENVLVSYIPHSFLVAQIGISGAPGNRWYIVLRDTTARFVCASFIRPEDGGSWINSAGWIAEWIPRRIKPGKAMGITPNYHHYGVTSTPIQDVRFLILSNTHISTRHFIPRLG